MKILLDLPSKLNDGAFTLLECYTEYAGTWLQTFGTACMYLLKGLNSPNIVALQQMICYYIVGGMGCDVFARSGGGSLVSRA
jgi:hypothetical protein